MGPKGKGFLLVTGVLAFFGGTPVVGYNHHASESAGALARIDVSEGLGAGMRPYIESMREPRTHVLARFMQFPTLSQRSLLKDRYDMRILDYVGDYVYVMSAPADFMAFTRILHDESTTIVGFEPLDPAGKLAPNLAGGKVPPYTRQGEDLAEFIVSFFSDVSEETQKAILARVKAREPKYIPPVNAWVILMNPQFIGRLSAEDTVRSLEAGPPVPRDDNDGARGPSGADVDALMASPGLDVSGSGVIIAQWEGNNADSGHPGLNGRLKIMDGPLLPSDRRLMHDETVEVNGYFDHGEGIYVDMNDDRKVSSDDWRSMPVTVTSGGVSLELAPGWVTGSDGDVDRSLIGFRGADSEAPEAYRDRLEPRGTLSDQESVYRGAGLCTGCPNYCLSKWRFCCVKSGAKRLTATGSYLPVGTVQPTDPDVGFCLKSLGTEPHGHATHVAGTMIGSGLMSPDLKWRGMAPEATILSFHAKGESLDFKLGCVHWDGSVGADSKCWLPQDYVKAIDNKAVIANNSWGFTLYSAEDGKYDIHSKLNDAVISGRDSDGLFWHHERPRLLLVGSSGNHRTYIDKNNVLHYWRNVRVANGAKNAVMVGSVTSDTNKLSTSTAFGPTGEGRLKPDLVAPGDEAAGDQGVTSTLPGKRYGQKSGSSMAAPVVSGVAALVMERYRDVCPSAGDPAPALVRGILLHSAKDLTTPPSGPSVPGLTEALVGPDYVYGYGLVQAKDAASLVTNHRNGVMTDAEPGVYNPEAGPSVPYVGLVEFPITVAPGRPLKVTLAWDDPASFQYFSTTGGKLVNDLDLVLVGPDGRAHFPWKLDPSDPAAPAGRGPDRHNTVEQVLVRDPVPGSWTIRVTARHLALPPQPFSVVSEYLKVPPVGCWLLRRLVRPGLQLPPWARHRLPARPVPIEPRQ